MTLRPLLPLSVLLLSVALPAPAQARPPLTFDLGYAAQVVTDRAWDMVDDNDHLPMLRLGLGWQQPLPLGKLGIRLGASTGSTSSVLHDRRDAGLWLRGLELGASWQYPLARFFSPYARVSAGLDWATLSIATGDKLEQRLFSPSVTGLLGFTVPMVTARELAGSREWLVLDVGLGWTARAAYDFDALRPADEGRADGPARAPVDAGELPISGFTWRLGITFLL